MASTSSSSSQSKADSVFSEEVQEEVERKDEEEEKGDDARLLETNEANTSDSSRVQTNTGQKLHPPIIRIERCRCVRCDGEPVFSCKQCKQEILLCMRCARRANHPHPLKSFRRNDEKILLLRRHLTLSYHEHIVSCQRSICMETCLESRYARRHFTVCDDRPRQLRDIINDGGVVFNGIGYKGNSCFSCGLFITCMFLHAKRCQLSTCHVAWCEEIRDTFDMASNDIYVVSDEMRNKCENVHKAEWKKVEDRLRGQLVEDILSIAL
ncbi:hypothetical protein GCK72_019101 [Caenorhabditis remanei]|uniref:TAZ-type domain-containing protein n=1 Tax=Caenorhabditis remanei TaxID=31234 RepID=A0A6A5GCG5_CAERE|nr:hypothetical protein GCK72_019101 [Caenorhabditis remanei]KAF1752546.1 hypothetical protein GCK72_019101 [Caenorhabditis remanei]